MATVSVTAGSAVVTGVGTTFEAYEGDLFVLSSEAVPILRVDSPTDLTLKYPWPNTSVSGSPDFAILKTGTFWRDTINVLSAVNTLLDKVNNGMPFSIGAAGSFAGRTSYNSQAAGFVYLASDPAPARAYVKTGPGSTAWTRGIVVEGTATVPGSGEPLTGGNVYFVSTAAGNDSNSGLTTASPWKTIDRVNAQTLQPGDQVAFRGGETYPGNLLVSNAGSSSGRIVYCAYGSGRPTISAGSGKAIYGLNTPYVDVRDIIALGASGNATHGIHFECNLAGNVKLAGPHIENCKATDFGWNGIYVQGTNGSSGFDDAKISYAYVENCTHNMVTNTGSAGIYVRASPAYGTGVRAHTNAVVEYCTVKNCPGTAGSANWTGSGILLSQVNGGTIRFCDTSLCGALGTFAGGGPVGAWTSDSTAIIIERNVSHENKGSVSHNQDGCGFDLDGGSVNCIVRYNLSYGNDGAGILIYAYGGDNLPAHQGNLVHHNLTVNDCVTNPQSSIHVRNDDTANPMSVDIFNNTAIHNKNHAALWVERIGGTITWRAANNILRATAIDGCCLVTINSEAGATLYGNCYYSDGFTAFWNTGNWNTLASFLENASTKERISSAIVANAYDPKFVGATLGTTDPNNYVLGAGSPVGDAGVNINSLFSVSLASDWFGVSIPQGTAPSVGISEIDSGADVGEAEISATYTFNGAVSAGYGNPTTDPTILRNGTFTAASSYKTDVEGTRAAPIWIIADVGSAKTLTGVNLGCEALARQLNGCYVSVSADGATWRACGQVWEAVPGQTHYFKLGRRAGMRYIMLWKGFDLDAQGTESKRIAIAEFRPLGY